MSNHATSNIDETVDCRVVQDVTTLIRSFQSPGERDSALADVEAIVTQLVDDVTQNSSVRAAATLNALLPELVRNAKTWPYVAGREALMKKIEWSVAKCREHGVAMEVPTDPGVSYLIPGAEIVPITTDDDEVREEFEEAFASDGRISNMTRVMAFHPEFLKSFREFHNALVGTVGPLTEDVRHFFAMMAASRYNCDYLVNVHLLHFRECDGDEDVWLNRAVDVSNSDSVCLPSSLAAVTEHPMFPPLCPFTLQWLVSSETIPEHFHPWLVINSLLAYAPWQLNKGHFKALEKHRWSKPDIVHGVLILAHFHALSSFVFAVGLHPELDLQADATSPLFDGHVSPHDSEPSQQQQWLADTIQRLKRGEEDSEPGLATSGESLEDDDATTTYEYDAANRWRQLFTAAHLSSWDPVWEERHRDFNPHEYKLFKTTDAIWTDHLYNEVSKHCSELAHKLDAEFSAIRNLTYAFIGQRTLEKVDTRRVRWAIWNYCLRVKGIEVDGFDYGNINSMIHQELKAYCKAVACYPEAMVPSIYHDFKVMQDSEKVHVALLTMDARKHSSLLFAFGALGFPSFINQP
eukprot:TRINITY_DN9053_c0_g1_i2.p1 TRINITY_DN9053_c0_g1~~TRINITY_DN9053_c0_g1_i2.p1  ORF type:complete len:577 (+),score=156.88 TRINITY_DN9053_c0_g1_i2:165-1895(+)